MVDLSVYGKLNSFSDYQRQNDEFELKKQLQAAQMQQAQATLMMAQAKAGEVDISKLGEGAFMKRSQGIATTPQEDAALNYLDAKSPVAAFNPVTGVMEQKPSLLQRAGLAGGQQQPMQQPAMNKPPMNPQDAATIQGLFAPDEASTTGNLGMSTTSPKSEWDFAFEKEMAAAAGNPKLQQTIRSDFAKSKISMNESESKSAGYADRMRNSNPIVAQTAGASSSATQSFLDSVPMVGNFLISDERQSANQAQKDFLNSILRRESGAVISPSEFANGKQQYFPVVGDTESTLAQKAANRESAIKGVSRSAGAAYQPTTMPPAQPTDKPASTAAKFLGF